MQEIRAFEMKWQVESMDKNSKLFIWILSTQTRWSVHCNATYKNDVIRTLLRATRTLRQRSWAWSQTWFSISCIRPVTRKYSPWDRICSTSSELHIRTNIKLLVILRQNIWWWKYHNRQTSISKREKESIDKTKYIIWFERGLWQSQSKNWKMR